MSVRAWARLAACGIKFNSHLAVTRDGIRNFQSARLRKLVKHAYENVPFYRRLFDSHGLHPRHIRGIGDLELIPISTKADLRACPPEDLLARGADPAELIEHSTGGSTGEPFTIRRSWIEERTLGLIRRRALICYGVPKGSLVLVATFHHHPLRNDRQWVTHLLEGISGYKLRSVFAMRAPEEVLEEIERQRPAVIGGYAGVLRLLADTLADQKIEISAPRLVLTGAEVLTPAAAERISAAFRAPVKDTYGCHEFARIAWQCPETGEYHRCDDALITETLNGSRQASEGDEAELVGTALHSYTMPFIRYRLGDVVTVGSETCRCGLSYSTLRQIRGRVVDYFRMPNGGLLHPYLIAAAIKSEILDWTVIRYQIVQEAIDRIVFTAVAASPPSEETLTGMKEAVHGVVGPGVRFEVSIVDDLSFEKSGKFRVYRSLVS